jgi:O-antigen/teichoic acid export membrane protein
MLGVPQARGSFFCLALVPLIRGFEHLRLSQLQRGNVFLPWAAATASMHVFGLVVVVASALVFRDHRAVLWSLGAQATGLVVSTHVLARVPYRLSLARLPISRALHFGMPLMLNGLAIAAIGQVDRLAVGSFLGVVQLGRYGLATMIFYLPVSLVMRIVTATLAPRLSTAWHVSPRWEFPALYRQIAFAIAVVAVLLASLVALMGNAIVSMVFGQVYRVDDGFFAILALVVLMKFAKITLNFAGLAMGRTVDVMVSNLPNAIGLGLTILGIMLVPSLSFAALGALAGEALGAAAALVLVRRHFRDDAHGAWLPMLTIVPVPCLAAAWSVLAAPPLDERVAVLGFGGVLAVCGAALLYRRRKPHFAVWS